MWEADKLAFRGVSSYVRAYRGSELVWELPDEETAFCITALADTDITFEMIGVFTDSSIINKNFQIKINRGEWQNWDGSTVSLTVGQKMYIYSNDSYPLSQTDEIFRHITSTGNINVSGDAASLINYSTTLPSCSFACLFRDCTTLINSNKLILNWTTVSTRCYSAMFKGCTNMVTAPELPAERLDVYCYNSMFNECTSLEIAPALPATILATACYNRMFNGCTSLTAAPVLPAHILITNCYKNMFNGCASLNYIKAMFLTTPSTTYIDSWVDGVSTTGTYVKNALATYTTRGKSGIPTGWTIDTEHNYLKFKALADSTVNLVGINEDYLPNVDYSFDGINWTEWEKGLSRAAIALNEGEFVYLRGLNTSWFCYNNSGYSTFKCTGRLKVSGNIMYLCNYNSSVTTIPANFYFVHLFENNTAIVDCSELILPATTLIQSCYRFMFKGCSNLVSAPSLPATEMKPNCYYQMFYNCTSLTTAPAMNATSFSFSCFYQMFMASSNLSLIKVMFTSSPSSSYVNKWVNGVAENGTFILPSKSNWTTRGVSGIPNNWNIIKV